MTELSINTLSVTAGSASLLDAVSFSVPRGCLTAVIGPNGAGKSTLLRAIVGLSPILSGTATLDGADIRSMAATVRARNIAYLPQDMPMAWPVRVRDAVSIGRFAFGGAPQRLSPGDATAVEAAIKACDLADLADRIVTSLSGGEKARAHIARTFATGAPLLLVDEPVAALDPAHRLMTMALLRAHCESGGSVIAVLHDLTLAARFADRIVGLRDGRLLCDGTVDAVMTAPMMAALFDVPMHIDHSQSWPSPMLL